MCNFGISTRVLRSLGLLLKPGLLNFSSTWFAPPNPPMPPLAIAMLVVAGLTYSGGVLLYLNHAIPFRRALWHACVIIGAAGHYGAVMIGLVLS